MYDPLWGNRVRRWWSGSFNRWMENPLVRTQRRSRKRREVHPLCTYWTDPFYRIKLGPNVRVTPIYFRGERQGTTGSRSWPYLPVRKRVGSTLRMNSTVGTSVLYHKRVSERQGVLLQVLFRPSVVSLDCRVTSELLCQSARWVLAV